MMINVILMMIEVILDAIPFLFLAGQAQPPHAQLEAKGWHQQQQAWALCAQRRRQGEKSDSDLQFVLRCLPLRTEIESQPSHWLERASWVYVIRKRGEE